MKRREFLTQMSAVLGVIISFFKSPLARAGGLIPFAFIKKNNSLPAFTTYTFTTCGNAASAVGPTLAQCQSSYAGAAWLANLSVPYQGVQQLILGPGNYRFIVAGARGGGAGPGLTAGSTYQGGGLGAVITADLTLSANTSVNIIVGSAGGSYTSTSQCGGGGGGSFVSLGANFLTSNLCIAAGAGGGGGSSEGSLSTANASTTTTGNGYGGGTAGSGGTTGSGSEAGASGSGWLSAGVGDANCIAPAVQSSIINGKVGVYGAGSNYGGFPGGAAGWGAGGGGSGYSGGGAKGSSAYSNRGSAGGGGSYTGNGASLVSAAVTNANSGYVTITKL